MSAALLKRPASRVPCSKRGVMVVVVGYLCIYFILFIYLYVCLGSVAGSLCEAEVNECSSSPCQNGGTCVDKVNYFTCSCADGYTGQPTGRGEIYNFVMAKTVLVILSSTGCVS